MDLHWKDGELFVGHDQGEFPLSEFGPYFENTSLFWWFDFKNLTYFNAQEVAAAFRKIFAAHQKPYFAVESCRAEALWRLPLSDSEKILCLKPLLPGGFDVPFAFIHFLKIAFIRPAFISMAYQKWGWLQKLLSFQRKSFLFTVNKMDTINDLFTSGADVVLTDEGHLAVNQGVYSGALESHLNSK